MPEILLSQRHPTDDDRRNMYNMAPFEDLDDTYAEPPPKWAAHFSSHLEVIND